MKKEDRIPALDPSQPNIYAQILEVAKQVREKQEKEILQRTEVAQLIDRIRREAAITARRALDSEQ